MPTVHIRTVVSCAHWKTFRCAFVCLVPFVVAFPFEDEKREWNECEWLEYVIRKKSAKNGPLVTSVIIWMVALVPQQLPHYDLSSSLWPPPLLLMFGSYNPII